MRYPAYFLKLLKPVVSYIKADYDLYFKRIEADSGCLFYGLNEKEDEQVFQLIK